MLQSFQVFWSNVFVFHVRVFQEINHLLKAFFWCGRLECKSSMRVARDEVCLPLKEGRLGIKHTTSWNMVAILKQIQMILICSGSLWVAWVEAYVFHDRSLWLVCVDAGMSWCFRAIIKCRDSLLPHVRLEVGDG